MTATPLGIREVSEQTGLSIDTLRWYEREGLLPLVERTATGQRRYPPGALRFIRLLHALRPTGMPRADVRASVDAGGGDLRNRAGGIARLQRPFARIDQGLGQLRDDLAVVQGMIRW